MAKGQMAKGQKEKEVLLILDANSLVHRAWHAIPDLRTSRGELVNALYGFLSILFRAIKEFQPSYIAVAFDVAGPTIRDKMYKEYKAKRRKAPDELYAQIPLVQEALAAMNIPVYEAQGYEADDIMGTISRLASCTPAHSSPETIIVSGDQDILQLVNESTRVYMANKGIKDTALFGLAEVASRFGGLTPEQIVDYKGLRGDLSDNLPGVKGIGEKTAIRLLSQYGSINELYSAIKKREAGDIPSRVADLLRQHEEDAKTSYELARIRRDVPLEFHLSDARWGGDGASPLREILKRYEFSSLVSRISDVFPGERALPALPTGQAGGRQGKESGDGLEEKIARLEQEGVLSEELARLERDLAPVLGDMERTGILINKKCFQGLNKELGRRLGAMEKKIAREAGSPFNINSPRQVADILFDTLGISPKGIKKTPGGAISTASSEMEKLLDEHPIVRSILEWRELSKLQTTYIGLLPEMTDKDGRLHTNYDQLGTASGRLSSSGPNLQNIPLKGEWGPQIRSCFIASPGWRFVSFDYSQMELRIVAHLAQDEKMLEAFEEGRDIHRSTASEVFEVPPEKVTKEQRGRAKALNFGIIYGMGEQGFARSAKIPITEARVFMERYFEKFSGIARYMEEKRTEAVEHGYAQTLFGRRRYLPEISSFNPRLRSVAERVAVNHVAQGTAADIMKMAMVAVARNISAEHKRWRMLLQIHDELLFEAPDGNIKETALKIRSIMEGAARGGLVLKVDVSTGPDWGNLVPLHNTHNA